MSFHHYHSETNSDYHTVYITLPRHYNILTNYIYDIVHIDNGRGN